MGSRIPTFFSRIGIVPSSIALLRREKESEVTENDVAAEKIPSVCDHLEFGSSALT